MSIRAKKALGQNFLKDDLVAKRIVEALEVTLVDTVVEIGPGTGALTRYLVEKAGRLMAVEFDRDLLAGLEREFGGSGRFELINADALGIDLERFGEEKVKIVANLPYNVATPILQRLAGQRDHIAAMVLMFQREVVERITATARSKQRGYLSVLSENAFEAKRLFDVAPTAFSPAPKVWSSVISLVPRPINVDDDELLRLVSAGFAHKRKTLSNNLKALMPEPARTISAAGMDPARRAETLTLDEWKQLLQSVKKAGASR